MTRTEQQQQQKVYTHTAQPKPISNQRPKVGNSAAKRTLGVCCVALEWYRSLRGLLYDKKRDRNRLILAKGALLTAPREALGLKARYRRGRECNGG